MYISIYIMIILLYIINTLNVLLYIQYLFILSLINNIQSSMLHTHFHFHFILPNSLTFLTKTRRCIFIISFY